MIRRISTSIMVPLTVRLASASQRHYHHCSTIISAANRRSSVCKNLFRRSLPSAFHRRYFCNLPDEDKALVEVIEEQIADAKELEGIDEDVVPIQEGEVPFEIEDYATRNYITLTRNYRDERIEVIVDMPILVPEEGDVSAEDNRCDSELPLVVRIFKKRSRCLEFVCSAYPDFISIESVTVKDPNNLDDELCYGGPAMWSLDERMEDALLRYLEIRGIKPSTTDFLHDYMIKKDGFEFLSWLHTIKDFVKS